MREALKNLFKKEIVLNDGSSYFYSISKFELKNVLGAVVAVLNEYVFSKGDESFRLYKTDDGNWYDLEESKLVKEKNILWQLKSAIDQVENTIIPE